MAIVKLSDPYMNLSGKLFKSDNVYFRTQYGKTIMCHGRRPRQTKYTAGEIERMQIFREVSKQTSALLADPATRHNLEMEWRMTGKKKFCTLHNYVMSRLYKETAAELAKQN